MTVGKIGQLTLPTICKHGYLARRCVFCDLEQDVEHLKDRLTAVTPLYPTDESVLRAQITKLVQENQRLEREVERLNEKIADIKAACWEGKQQGQ
jgi:regulator of replication initiation timing